MNEREERPVSDLQLERYLLREGSPSELADLDRRVAADPVLAQRLVFLERSNEELQRRYPPAWMCRQIERKLKRVRSGNARRPWSGYRLWPVPAVALVILAVVAVPTLFDQETPKEAPALRVKGGEQGPRLLVFRKLADGSERLQDGASARSGDLVQIAYRSDGLAYGAILSVDGRGTVTQHLPASGEKAVPLEAQDTLDFAFELDDAPLRERFYLVAGERRFGLASVRAKLAGGDEAVGDDVRLFRFTVKKPGSP